MRCEGSEVIECCDEDDEPKELTEMTNIRVFRNSISRSRLVKEFEELVRSFGKVLKSFQAEEHSSDRNCIPDLSSPCGNVVEEPSITVFEAE